MTEAVNLKQTHVPLRIAAHPHQSISTTTPSPSLHIPYSSKPEMSFTLGHLPSPHSNTQPMSDYHAGAIDVPTNGRSGAMMIHQNAALCTTSKVQPRLGKLNAILYPLAPQALPYLLPGSTLAAQITQHALHPTPHINPTNPTQNHHVS
jgi:hypothetical protein